MSTNEPASGPDAAPEPALLPRTSIRHIMKRTMGGEHEAITAPSVSAVQRCSTEFLSLVVSEARARVAKDRRSIVTYNDIIAALNHLGFKQFQEPLKAHMLTHYGGAAIKRPAKRARTSADADANASVGAPASGADASVGNPVAGVGASVGAPAAGRTAGHQQL